MRFQDRPFALWAWPLAMLALSLALLASDTGGIATRLRGTLFDAYQHSGPRPPSKAALKVRILTSDPESQATLGPWPWAHATLARLLETAHAKGLSLAVFTTPLDRTDPVSPTNLLPLVPSDHGFDNTRALLQGMASPDTALTSAISSLPSAIGIEPRAQGGAPQTKPVIQYRGRRDPLGQIPAFGGASTPLPAIASAAQGMGLVQLRPDSDGKLRRMPLVARIGGKPMPGIEAEAFRLSQNDSALVFRGDDGEAGLFGGKPGLAALTVQRAEIPTAPDGAIWLWFARADKTRALSASDILNPAGENLANTILLVGDPDAQVMTPDGSRSVLSVRAEALENLLTGEVLRRPASAAQAELFCLGIFGIALIVLFARFGTRWAGLAAFVFIAGLGVISWEFYTSSHVLFDALSPGLALLMVFGIGGAARLSQLGKMRAAARLAFADTLPPATIARIAAKPSLLKLDGEMRTVTYLACGVRDFARVAESFRDDPASFTRLLQRVIAPLMDEAMAHGGAIGRLTAEGFTAFWNAPLDDSEHAIHACNAANAMMDTIARINETVTQERRIDGMGLPPIEIGVGVSTGPAIAGGFKTHGRTAYSVTGDCTVMANRIQDLSAQYGPAVIVGEETRQSAERGFAFLEVDHIAIGTHDEPTKLYAMLGNPLMRASPKFRALATFHEHIFQSIRTQQWEKARVLIEQCRKLSGASQKLYDLHLKRIEYFENNPPALDWDGAFRAILK